VQPNGANPTDIPSPSAVPSTIPTQTATPTQTAKPDPTVSVPDVRGENVDDATAVLQGLGFVVSVESQLGDDVTPPLFVLDQFPASLAKVKPGSTVTLTAVKVLPQ
jgi:beta-lactam-binding protein with PASTA domain